MHLDLNLLLALDALLEEGSVGGAARRMHVTSPAMSRTLARIRDLTKDDVFVRTGRHMTPTPYALSIRDEVHDLVLRAQTMLSRRGALDLSALERTFTLQGHDAIASAIGARLLARVRQAAPRVTLRLLAETAFDSNDLRHGKVDLDLGASTPTHRDLAHQAWGTDELVVAMRARHPLSRRALTLAGYAAAEHVTVSRRGRLRDPVDEALAARGLARRVVVAAPTSSIALRMVSETDLLVTVPRRMCAAAIRSLRLHVAALPLRAQALTVIAAWHRRNELDPAHAWLREQARQAVDAVLGGNPGRATS